MALLLRRIGTSTITTGTRSLSTLAGTQEDSQFVIVGGGIIGLATAYQLGKLGHGKRVTVLEANTLTSGTTWHAAGLVTVFKGHPAMVEMCKVGAHLYPTFVDEDGNNVVGWKNTGSLTVARTADRWKGLQRTQSVLKDLGVDYKILSKEELKDLYPLMDTDVVHAAGFVPADGLVNPSDVALYMASEAKKMGARIIENCPVQSLKQTPDGLKVTEVVTESHGSFLCDKLLLACGQWTPEVAAMADVAVPLSTVPHQYQVTDVIDGVTDNTPIIRDYDGRIYIKPEVGGLVVGEFDAHPKPVPGWRDTVPKLAYHLLEEDYERTINGLEHAMSLIPAIGETGLKRALHGPDAHTPDHEIIMGPAPRKDNVFVAAGFNSQGIQSAAGVGLAMSEWMIHGNPQSFVSDFFELDLRRFDPEIAADRQWCEDRALEGYSMLFPIHWPGHEFHTGRDRKLSPLHSRMKNHGGVFGQSFGWERPNWFAPEGTLGEDTFSWDHTRVSWHDHVRNEHLNTRNHASVFDLSMFGKFVIHGPEADKAARWLFANDTDKPVGSIIYTQMLDKNAGIRSDLTVTRTAEDSFYCVIGAGVVEHDWQWMRQQIASNGFRAHLSDITQDRGVLSLMGPNARLILESVSSDDVSNAVMPFGTSKMISIGGRPVRALRVSYVGELGWELHAENDDMGVIFDAIWHAGRQYNLAPAGYRAMNTLRMEKRYVHWGHDVTPLENPLEAGLLFATKVKTDTDFLGRDALQRARETGAKKRLATFTVDTEPGMSLWGREVLYRNNEKVGYLTSVGYGHSCDKFVGFGFVEDPAGGSVNKKFVEAGEYEVEAFGQRLEASVVPGGVVYDPKMHRMKETGEETIFTAPLVRNTTKAFE